MDLLENADFSINVISNLVQQQSQQLRSTSLKSSSLKNTVLKKRKKRIYATTDKARGALKTLATEEGYESFIILMMIGGRYSVLTAVGLLPIAVCGADIDQMMEGAAKASETLLHLSFLRMRHTNMLLFVMSFTIKGRTIEMLINYEPGLQYFAEWWKQLFGESEGKDEKGIYLPLRTSQQIFIHLVNMSKKEEETCLKQS
ncbi:hypothetical protein ACEQPO_23555 [Bacillus sp. SL00103]